MKDVTVEVVVLGMNAKVFDCFRTLSREQFQHDVTQCRVQHGRLEVARPRLVLLGDGDTVLVRRFFVKHVTISTAGCIPTSAPVIKNTSFESS